MPSCATPTAPRLACCRAHRLKQKRRSDAARRVYLNELTRDMEHAEAFSKHILSWSARHVQRGRSPGLGGEEESWGAVAGISMVRQTVNQMQAYWLNTVEVRGH